MAGKFLIYREHTRDISIILICFIILRKRIAIFSCDLSCRFLMVSNLISDRFVFFSLPHFSEPLS